jgi:hypothetical protein
MGKMLQPIMPDPMMAMPQNLKIPCVKQQQLIFIIIKLTYMLFILRISSVCMPGSNSDYR